MGFYSKHKNIIYFSLSILVAAYLVQNAFFIQAVTNINSLGYLGNFITGLGFSYAFTTPLTTVTIYALGKIGNPFYIAFIGGFGAMISDYIIFRFFRDRLWKEINFVVRRELKLKLPKISKLAKSKIFSSLVPAIAGLIIASPLPDEPAMLLLASVKYKTRNMLILSYWLNFLGILAIASANIFLP